MRPMSAIATVLSLFGLGSNNETEAPTLESLLAEREETLSLTAEYVEPTVNMQGEPTAVFYATLYHNGEEYGAHAKEFALPERGLKDEDAPLTRFLANYGITSRANIADIAGVTEAATLNEDGEITIDVTDQTSDDEAEEEADE